MDLSCDADGQWKTFEKNVKDFRLDAGPIIHRGKHPQSSLTAYNSHNDSLMCFPDFLVPCIGYVFTEPPLRVEFPNFSRPPCSHLPYSPCPSYAPYPYIRSRCRFYTFRLDPDHAGLGVHVPSCEETPFACRVTSTEREAPLWDSSEVMHRYLGGNKLLYSSIAVMSQA